MKLPTTACKCTAVMAILKNGAWSKLYAIHVFLPCMKVQLAFKRST
ncbi:Uncharacterised protein [Mycobacteroides abscessus subsp. abscessus]|nr:Uncharacterised protein [Mycobacteroides abscessus subsp. abscessus]